MEHEPRFPALRAALLASYGATRPLPPDSDAVLTTLIQPRGLSANLNNCSNPGPQALSEAQPREL